MSRLFVRFGVQYVICMSVHLLKREGAGHAEQSSIGEREQKCAAAAMFPPIVSRLKHRPCFRKNSRKESSEITCHVTYNSRPLEIMWALPRCQARASPLTFSAGDSATADTAQHRTTRRKHLFIRIAPAVIVLPGGRLMRASLTRQSFRAKVKRSTGLRRA